MSKVKRWEPEHIPELDTFNMRIDDDGDFVLHQDYEQLQATNKQLLSALEEMAGDYEAQINAEYTEANLIYPSYKRRYDADMETLNKAKTAITNAKGE